MLWTKHRLSPARRWLIEEMQRIRFGRIERLVVRAGEPVISPRPLVVREVKLPAGPRPEARTGDFLLKAQVVELLQLLDEMGDGTIEVIEVKHGLPFRVFVPEAAA